MDVLGLFRLEIDGKNIPELPVVILTVVSYAISILLYSTHLIVFSFTQKMWTTSGKVLASFCISTILGFCAYISSIVVKNDHNLYVAGIIITYYCSLTHSSWLLTISVECWWTSAKTKYQKAYRNESTSRFIWYSFFSWLEPALFLGLALYAEFFETPAAVLPTYLKPTFITNKKGYSFQPILAFVLFFVGPLCFNLLLNAIFLIRTYYLMKRLVNSDFSSENLELAHEFKLYCHFNILVTLTWLANLVDAFLTRNIIWNAIIISLSAVQALYVLFVFTFNNKMWMLMRHEDEELDLETFTEKTDVENMWGRSDVV